MRYGPERVRSRWRAPGTRSALVKLALLLAAALGTGTVHVSAFGARPQIEVVGLFRDHVVLRSGGQEKLISTGDVTADGMRLISASSDGAVFEFRGEQFTYQLSGRAGAQFSAPRDQSVTIGRDRTGQYRTRGMINGQVVDLLVDTGASVVAMSGVEAQRLGVQIDANTPVARVVTAQGEADSHLVTLARVQVGSIEVFNVEAVIIDGAYPVDVLLGMSFLGTVSLQETGGVLTLRR